jgi:hypothetical protein
MLSLAFANLIQVVFDTTEIGTVIQLRENIFDVRNAVFWDVMLCASCENRQFGGKYQLLQHDGKNQRARNNVISNKQLTKVVPSSPILFTRIMEAIRSPQKVGSYKSHTASHPRGQHSS